MQPIVKKRAIGMDLFTVAPPIASAGIAAAAADNSFGGRASNVSARPHASGSGAHHEREDSDLDLYSSSSEVSSASTSVPAQARRRRKQQQHVKQGPKRHLTGTESHHEVLAVPNGSENFAVQRQLSAHDLSLSHYNRSGAAHEAVVPEAAIAATSGAATAIHAEGLRKRQKVVSAAATGLRPAAGGRGHPAPHRVHSTSSSDTDDGAPPTVYRGFRAAANPDVASTPAVVTLDSLVQQGRASDYREAAVVLLAGALFASYARGRGAHGDGISEAATGPAQPATASTPDAQRKMCRNIAAVIERSLHRILIDRNSSTAVHSAGFALASDAPAQPTASTAFLGLCRRAYESQVYRLTRVMRDPRTAQLCAAAIEGAPPVPIIRALIAAAAAADAAAQRQRALAGAARVPTDAQAERQVRAAGGPADTLRSSRLVQQVRRGSGSGSAMRRVHAATRGLQRSTRSLPSKAVAVRSTGETSKIDAAMQAPQQNTARRRLHRALGTQAERSDTSSSDADEGDNDVMTSAAARRAAAITTLLSRRRPDMGSRSGVLALQRLDSAAVRAWEPSATAQPGSADDNTMIEWEVRRLDNLEGHRRAATTATGSNLAFLDSDDEADVADELLMASGTVDGAADSVAELPVGSLTDEPAAAADLIASPTFWAQDVEIDGNWAAPSPLLLEGLDASELRGWFDAVEDDAQVLPPSEAVLTDGVVHVLSS